MTNEVADKISKEDFEAAQLLSKEGEDAIQKAEESGDLALETRAKIARTILEMSELGLAISTVKETANRKRTERALRESEKKHRDLLGAVPSIIYRIDENGCFEYVNRFVKKVLGYRPDELIGEHFSKIIHPEDVKGVSRFYVLPEYRGKMTGDEHSPQLFDERRAWDKEKGKFRGTAGLEVRLIRKGWGEESDDNCVIGSLVSYGVVSASGVYNEKEFRGTTGIVQDISKRRQAEAALLESESRYRALFENMPIGLGLVTEDGDVIEGNDALLEMAGYSRMGFDKANLGDIYRDFKIRASLMEQLRRDGSVTDFEAKVKRQDGSSFHLSSNLMPFVLDDKDCILMTAMDISDRVLAKKEVKVKQRFNELLLDSLPHPVMVINSKREILAANKIAKDTGAILGGYCWRDFGHCKSIGKVNKQRLMHSEASDCKEVKCTFCLADEAMAEFEPQNDDRVEVDGKTYDVHWIPLEDAGMFLCYSVDITERTQLEAQLRQAQKMEAVGQLAGGIAHDFNNALTAIGGSAQLVELTLGAGHSSREDLKVIQEATDKAAILVSQLLAFSRKQVLNPKVISVVECLRNIERMSRSTIPENIDLSFSFDSNLDPIKIDPAQFDHSMLNLIVNARDAMPEGGKLHVSASNVNLTEDDLKIFNNVGAGPHVRISVQDTGTGISPDHLDQVFDPFFTTKGEEGKGTGLGLSGAHGTIRQSGGDIVVENTGDEGTTFVIVLPSHQSSVDGNHIPYSRRSPELLKGSGNVILIEDEVLVRTSTGRILKQAGYKVELFPGGSEALSFFDGESDELQFKPSEVDLVISDVVMPNMDGLVFAEKLHEQYPRIEVIFVSGHPGDTHNIDPSDHLFLQKPFNGNELIKMIKERIEGKEES